MKKHFCKKLLIGAVLLSTIICGKDSFAKTPEGKWKSAGSLWWFQYSNGDYAKNEYIDGYWMDRNGLYNAAWNGDWATDGKGWWFQSGSWYPTNQWLKIDGLWYYFKADGYMASGEWAGNYYLQKDGTLATSKWIGKYYVGEDGAWVQDQAYPEDFTAAVNSAKKADGKYDFNKFLTYFGFQGAQAGHSKGDLLIKSITFENPKIMELWNKDKYYKFNLKTSGDYNFGEYSLTTEDMLNIYFFIKDQNVEPFEIQNNPHKPTT